MTPRMAESPILPFCLTPLPQKLHHLHLLSSPVVSAYQNDHATQKWFIPAFFDTSDTAITALLSHGSASRLQTPHQFLSG
jgi:hypothetical protein